MPAGARTGVPYPGLLDPADGPDLALDIVNRLEAVMALDEQGILADRPVSTPGSPGKRGRYFMTTDQSPNILYRDNGTGWDAIGQIAEDSITNFHIAPGAVRSAEIEDLTIVAGDIANLTLTNAKIADGVIEYEKLHPELKPSQGAGGGTEALRALGTDAGMAAAGKHAPTHASTGADPLVDVLLTPTQFRALAPVLGQKAHVLNGGGEVWSFICVDPTGSKSWQFTGGTELYAVNGAVSVDTPGGYFVFPDSGPVLTVPLAGTYWVAGYGDYQATDAFGAYLAVQIDAGAGAIFAYLAKQSGSGAGFIPNFSAYGKEQLGTLVRGSSVRLAYYNLGGGAGAGTLDWALRKLWLVPKFVSQA